MLAVLILATASALLAPAPAVAAEFNPWSPTDASRELSLPDLQGKPRDLRNFAGQVVLVNFWASWCPPCREEMPEFEDIQRKYGDRGLSILSVNLAEGKARIESFLQAWFPDGAPFIVLQDRNSQAYKHWRVRALPSSFLLDRHGRIRWVAVGPISLADDSTTQRIEALLKEASPNSVAQNNKQH